MKAVLMDGYVTDGSERITRNGVEYEVTTYQGEHCDEYLVREVKSGRCELFCKGILQFSWRENNGVKIGGFTVYEKGKALRSEDWKGLGGKEHRRIENCRNGLELVVEGNGVVYRGGFDSVESMKREGSGMEFDEKSGRVLRCGVWKNDELFQIEMEFESEDVMIEYDIEEGRSNLNVLNRHPVYEGGYVFNEEKKEVLRHGEGCEIEGGVAVREEKWERGELKESVELFEGWYVKREGSDVFQWGGKKANETISMDLNDDEPEILTRSENRMRRNPYTNDSIQPVNLRANPESPNRGSESPIYYSNTIQKGGVCERIDERKREGGNNKYGLMFKAPPVFFHYSSITTIDDAYVKCEHIRLLQCPDYRGHLSLSKLSGLVSVVIDDDSLNNATFVTFISMNKLESITIGTRSLTAANGLRIENCDRLESLKIGPHSFRNATSFIVMNGDSLKSITIGSDTEYSYNFMICDKLVLSCG